jgi:hypothetical protein
MASEPDLPTSSNLSMRMDRFEQPSMKAPAVSREAREQLVEGMRQAFTENVTAESLMRTQIPGQQLHGTPLVGRSHLAENQHRQESRRRRWLEADLLRHPTPQATSAEDDRRLKAEARRLILRLKGALTRRALRASGDPGNAGVPHEEFIRRWACLAEKGRD